MACILALYGIVCVHHVDVATAGQSEDVGIAMEHPQDEGTFMDVEIDPRFAMSVRPSLYHLTSEGLYSQKCN